MRRPIIIVAFFVLVLDSVATAGSVRICEEWPAPAAFDLVNMRSSLDLVCCPGNKRKWSPLDDIGAWLDSFRSFSHDYTAYLRDSTLVPCNHCYRVLGQQATEWRVAGNLWKRSLMGGSKSGGGISTSPMYSMSRQGILDFLDYIKKTKVKPKAGKRMSLLPYRLPYSGDLCEWCRYRPKERICHVIYCVYPYP